MISGLMMRAGLFMLALLLISVPLPAQAQGGTTVTPEQVENAIQEIEILAQQQIDTNTTPGLAIAVVYDDKVVYQKGFGLREVGKPDPVTEDTVFQIASMSKPVASTVAAALVSDGVVTWDTRVSQVDPALQLHDPYPTDQVTIRDLFSHQSGLGGGVGNDLVALGYDRDTMLQRLRFVEPGSSFRSGYDYSNAGITAGAVAAAKPTGETWEQVSADKLYQPLGMTSTSSSYTDFLSRTNRAALHTRVDGNWAAAVEFNDDAQSPAGGVSASVKDLAQWLRLQIGTGSYDGEQLISEEALAQTRLPINYLGLNPVSGNPTWYGLGMNVEYSEGGALQQSHAGAFTHGARTFFSTIPSEKLGIVVLSNSFPQGVPQGITATFFDLVHYGQPRRDWVQGWNEFYENSFGPSSYASLVALYAEPPAVPSPALPASAYLGTYTNNYFGDVRIIEQNGGLALQAGPDQLTFPLKHFDNDLFIYYPYVEIPDYPSAATFTIGPEQKAVQVVINNLNSNGQGVLTRVPEVP